MAQKAARASCASVASWISGRGAIGPVEETRAVLHRIGAFDLHIVLVEQILEGDIALRDGVLENLGDRIAGFHGARHEFGVLVVNAPDLVFDPVLECGIQGRRTRPARRGGMPR